MNHRATKLAVLLVTTLGVTTVWFAAADRGRPAAPPVAAPTDSLGGRTMGGTWSVRLGTPADPVAASRLTGLVQRTLDQIDGRMSTWNPASDLSRFNAHRGADWFAVPPDLAAVVAEAQQVAADTGGAFDVTVGPLVNLWGFGPARPASGPAAVVPPDADIAAARVAVGHHLLECRPSPPALRKLRPEVYVDLSAIAQGYAADRVAADLDAAGVTDYLVDVCGEMRARGSSPAGRPWRVGIETPTPGVRRVLRTVELRDVALATSGDYRNFRVDDAGRRYSHEIDPRTGRPADNGLASVSVAHPSAARADAMATALMVLGPAEGYAFARRSGLAAMFVVRGEGRFEVRATPEFERMLLPESSDAPR